MSLDEYFISEGCRLIEKQGRYVTYIARCGHEHKTRLDTFKHGSSRMCRNCIYENMRRSDSDYHIQEGDSFIYISKLLENFLEIKRTNEGCFADFIFRPCGIQDDKWAQVQLKTTKKSIHGVYNFSMHKRYTGCIIMCHCTSEDRFWIFRDYEVPEKGLGIRNNGKYSVHEVLSINIHENLKNNYNTSIHIKFNEAIIPINQTQRIEHEYRLKRERFFSYVKFEYPIHEHRRYDFIVNGKKYQEKVATFKNNRFVFTSKYKLCDNDFYFVHIPNTDYFYCIPEKILLENQNSSGCITLNINKHHKWYAPYRHTYTRIDFSF